MPFFFCLLRFGPILGFSRFFIFWFFNLSQVLAHAHMERPRTLEECAAGCAEHYVVSLGLRFHLQLEFGSCSFSFSANH